jgi:DNA-binding MarR family transcriptional regulator
MIALDETLGAVLVQVCRAHRAHAAVVLGGLGLHPGQEWILLRLIEEEGTNQSRLVACLGVEPPTITKMLHRLERGGFVERRPDPSDARLSRVFLTDRGRALDRPIRAAWAALEERTTMNLTLEERILLRRLLLQVLANLE